MPITREFSLFEQMAALTRPQPAWKFLNEHGVVLTTEVFDSPADAQLWLSGWNEHALAMELPQRLISAFVAPDGTRYVVDLVAGCQRRVYAS